MLIFSWKCLYFTTNVTSTPSYERCKFQICSLGKNNTLYTVKVRTLYSLHFSLAVSQIWSSASGENSDLLYHFWQNVLNYSLPEIQQPSYHHPTSSCFTKSGSSSFPWLLSFNTGYKVNTLFRGRGIVDFNFKLLCIHLHVLQRQHFKIPTWDRFRLSWVIPTDFLKDCAFLWAAPWHAVVTHSPARLQQPRPTGFTSTRPQWGLTVPYLLSRWTTAAGNSESQGLKITSDYVSFGKTICLKGSSKYGEKH